MTPTVHDEELINAATHGLGLGGAVAASVVLLWIASHHGTPWQIAGCSIYAATLMAAYAASTLSHAFRRPGPRHAFRVADQAIIFLFIAGSFTPLAFTYLRTGAWWLLTGTIWLVALFGFFRKAVFSHRVQVGAVSVGLYLLLGWLPVLAAKPMIETVPTPFLLLIFAGGLCYSAGIIFFQFDARVRYFHAAWHLMVIAGTACHYIGILTYCTRAVT